MAVRKRKKRAAGSKACARGYTIRKRKKRAAGRKKGFLDKVLSVLD